jgi:adenylate cyclase
LTGDTLQPSDREITVMFADIAGSTRLSEIIGDKAAEELISSTLKQLSDIVVNYNGDIIKTIGDELMCRFPNADDAITAARQMHEFLAEKTAPSRDYTVAIRIGAHHGPIIESDGDIFGDTVNVSARVAALARAGKTMITGYTCEQLQRGLKENCRHIMQTTVKGKELPIDVFDVAWEQDDELTCIAGNNLSDLIGDVLTVQHDGNTIKMSAKTITSITIGRGKECDLIIGAPQASRAHCKIENIRGKFIFSDNSTNGSYIHHNGIELFFHQERAPLLGSGHISLGEPSEKNSQFLLQYAIESI